VLTTVQAMLQARHETGELLDALFIIKEKKR
jgi:hypothetical protein